MVDKEDFDRRVRRTAFLTVGFVAGLVFAVVLLANGDWLPGAVILVATLVGLAAQLPIIRRICSKGPPPSPTTGKPAG